MCIEVQKTLFSAVCASLRHLVKQTHWRMVRRCCIVTCRNCRTDCDEKVSFFKVPNERTQFEKWVKAIIPTGSTINKSSSICERHFQEGEIKRQAVLKDSFGNVLFQKPLTKFSLSKEAVPSIFDKDIDSQTLRKRRKRRSVIADYLENFTTLINEGNINTNYGNILVSFNENDNMQLTLTPNNTQSVILPSNDKNKEQNNENNIGNIVQAFETANGFVNEVTQNNGFHNVELTNNNVDNRTQVTEDGRSIISIYYKPQGEENMNLVNDDINGNVSETIQSIDVSSNEPNAQKIPNQFTNFNTLTLDNAPKEVTIIVPDDEIIILNESNNVKRNNGNNKKSAQPKGGTINYPLPESDIQMNIRSFDEIFYNTHKLKLPNAMWGYHKNSIDKDIIIFSKARWFKSDVMIPPIYERQVIFHESDNVKIYINSKFSPLEVRRPKDMQEMELILKHVDEIAVCSGGPNMGECDTAHCAQKDYAVNRWRHKLCPIILNPGETICKFCSTINQVMRYPKKKKLPFGRRTAVRQES